MAKRKNPPRAYDYLDSRMQAEHAHRDPGLQAAIAAMGGRMSWLARELGLTPQAVSLWKEVPLDRLLQIEAVTGVDRRVLRPDIFSRKRKT